MVNNDLMPSSLEFMIAAFAASSVVGASTCGVPGRCGVFEPVKVGERDLAIPGSAAPKFLFVTGFAGANGAETTFTGIMTTFLKLDMKSRFAACRLRFDMKKDSADASCSESSFSQRLTSACDFALKTLYSSAR